MKKLFLSLLLISSVVFAMDKKDALDSIAKSALFPGQYISVSSHQPISCGHASTQEPISPKTEKEKMAQLLGISTDSFTISDDRQWLQIPTSEGSSIMIGRCAKHNAFPDTAIPIVKAKLAAAKAAAKADGSSAS